MQHDREDRLVDRSSLPGQSERNCPSIDNSVTLVMALDVQAMRKGMWSYIQFLGI